MNPTTMVGLVTGDTPASLEYGSYRGWVEIDAETGEWLRNLTDEERSRLVLGNPEPSSEYHDLRPVVGRRYAVTSPAASSLRPIMAESAHDAAYVAAGRIARRLYGRRGCVGTCHLDSRAADGSQHVYQAYVGKPGYQRGTIEGRNVWIYVDHA